MTTKPCSTCATVLEVNEENFFKSKTGKDGFIGQCKPCRYKIARQWAISHPEEIKGYRKDWNQKNPEKHKESTKKWRQENPDKYRSALYQFREENPEKIYLINQKSNFRTKYGLTQEQYETACKNQNGCCYICCQPFEPLHVDHDHATKKVRGLLCNHCNNVLGRARDNPEILRRAIEYLISPPGLSMVQLEMRNPARPYKSNTTPIGKSATSSKSKERTGGSPRRPEPR